MFSHPDTPATKIDCVTPSAQRDENRLKVCWHVAGAERLRLTDGAAVRTDGLWRHTCFEVFVAGTGEEYREYNFAPSGAWAAYAFDRYRAGMRPLDAAPVIGWDGATLTAEVDVDLAGEWRINLSAVIEEQDGTKSYWALAHPAGPPDFHDPGCFVLHLPASPAR